jgi:hypothetical protein
MHPIYVGIILALTFFIPLTSLSPFLSPGARQILFDLWINKGIPLNLGMCIGLFIGIDVEARAPVLAKQEIKEAIREGLRKVQNNS